MQKRWIASEPRPAPLTILGPGSPGLYAYGPGNFWRGSRLYVFPDVRGWQRPLGIYFYDVNKHSWQQVRI